MPDTKTYVGSCHCGAVRYEVETDLARVISCNCSMCGRAGWLLTFVNADKFKLLSGEDALGDYHFNTKKISHLFCKVCGIKAFSKGMNATGQEMRSINVRCLEGVDPDTLSVTKVDGKSR
jgi:hypothetical protein